jgi:hypothetical protein
MVQSGDYIKNISPINLRESDYGSLEETLFHLCERV